MAQFTNKEEWNFPQAPPHVLDQTDNEIVQLENEFHGQTHSIFPPSIVKEDLTFFLDLIDEASKIAKENPIDIFNSTESTASTSSENKEEGAISLQVGAPWSSLGLQFRKLRISQLRNQQQVRLPEPHEHDHVGRLTERDMDLFGYTPAEDALVLVKCMRCFKTIKASRFTSHIGKCPRTWDLASFAPDETLTQLEFNNNVISSSQNIPTPRVVPPPPLPCPKKESPKKRGKVITESTSKKKVKTHTVEEKSEKIRKRREKLAEIVTLDTPPEPPLVKKNLKKVKKEKSPYGLQHSQGHPTPFQEKVKQDVLGHRVPQGQRHPSASAASQMTQGQYSFGSQGHPISLVEGSMTSSHRENPQRQVPQNMGGYSHIPTGYPHPQYSIPPQQNHFQHSSPQGYMSMAPPFSQRDPSLSHTLQGQHSHMFPGHSHHQIYQPHLHPMIPTRLPAHPMQYHYSPPAFPYEAKAFGNAPQRTQVEIRTNPFPPGQHTIYHIGGNPNGNSGMAKNHFGQPSHQSQPQPQPPSPTGNPPSKESMMRQFRIINGSGERNEWQKFLVKGSSVPPQQTFSSPPSSQPNHFLV